MLSKNMTGIHKYNKLLLLMKYTTKYFMPYVLTLERAKLFYDFTDA